MHVEAREASEWCLRTRSARRGIWSGFFSFLPLQESPRPIRIAPFNLRPTDYNRVSEGEQGWPGSRPLGWRLKEALLVRGDAARLLERRIGEWRTRA
jgi:hypothetical protein